MPKRLLREAGKRWLPEAVLSRRDKAGFPDARSALARRRAGPATCDVSSVRRRPVRVGSSTPGSWASEASGSPMVGRLSTSNSGFAFLSIATSTRPLRSAKSIECKATPALLPGRTATSAPGGRLRAPRRLLELCDGFLGFKKLHGSPASDLGASASQASLAGLGRANADLVEQPASFELAIGVLGRRLASGRSAQRARRPAPGFPLECQTRKNAKLGGLRMTDSLGHTKRPKVLLVSFFFPPTRAIGGRRAGRLARLLPENGFDVDVVCGQFVARNNGSNGGLLAADDTQRSLIPVTGRIFRRTPDFAFGRDPEGDPGRGFHRAWWKARALPGTVMPHKGLELEMGEVRCGRVRRLGTAQRVRLGHRRCPSSSCCCSHRGPGEPHGHPCRQ